MSDNRERRAGVRPESARFTGAPNGLLGMAADLAILFSSFEILASDPTNLSVRQSVVRRAQDLAAQLQMAWTRLKSLEYALNTSIQRDVVRANYHLHDIACYNEQIRETRSAGGSTESWESQRARCLDALECCLHVASVTNPDGSLNISVGGVTLVAGPENPDCLATYPDARANLRIQSQNSGQPLPLAGGSIASKIAARDGRLAELQNGLDTFAAQLTRCVNSIFQAGCDLNGETGRAFFIGGSAADIAVNGAVAEDPLLLQTGGIAPRDGHRGVARALAQLGRDQFLGLGEQGSHDADTIEIVNNTFGPAREDVGKRTPPRRPRGEKASFARYQQACASTFKMMSALERMAPMN